MKEALVLCVISALLPGLHGNITCATCAIQDTKCGTYCTGESCIAIQVVSSSEKSVNGTYKDCISSAACKPLSITLSTFSTRHTLITTACCESDNCTDSLILSVPPTGDFNNGVSCPVCEKDEPECKSTGYIDCTGLEEKCIALEGKSIAEPAQNFSLKGCASRNACSMKLDDLVAYNGSIYSLTTNASCTDRGTLSALSSPAAVFLPAVVGYLLANIIPDL